MCYFKAKPLILTNNRTFSSISMHDKRFKSVWSKLKKSRKLKINKNSDFYNVLFLVLPALKCKFRVCCVAFRVTMVTDDDVIR